MRMALPFWLLLLTLGACAAPPGQTAPQPRGQTVAPKPCVQDGVASWYTPGRGLIRMANGQRLRRASLTAAHRFLPFGTMVRVTDLETDRSVVVRITDRGPFPRGRIIDVSPAAARVLEMRRAGVAPVRLQIDGPAETFCLLREAAGLSPPLRLAANLALATALYGTPSID